MMSGDDVDKLIKILEKLDKMEGKVAKNKPVKSVASGAVEMAPVPGASTDAVAGASIPKAATSSPMLPPSNQPMTETSTLMIPPSNLAKAALSSFCTGGKCRMPLCQSTMMYQHIRLLFCDSFSFWTSLHISNKFLQKQVESCCVETI